MRDTIDPRIDFNWRPTLWAAGVVVLCGLAGNFVFARPQLLGHGTLVAGIVSSFRSEYYQNSGYSAAVGTLIGALVLAPVLVYLRVTFMFGIEGTGDTLFVSGAITAVWVIIIFVILMPIAYIGSLVGDFTRKKLDGPLGY